jgi:hypothetical protein
MYKSRRSTFGVAICAADVQLGQEYSLFHFVQTGYGHEPASYLGGSGVKQPVRDADSSPQISVQVKKMWFYTSTLPYVFM